MSKASRQTIGLLALISGCMTTIYTSRLAPAHDPLTLYAGEACDKIVKVFPSSGKEQKLQSWVEIHLTEYDKALSSMPDEKYNAALLTAMAVHIILDLQNKIRDPKKLTLLEPIYEAVTALNEAVDPLGRKIKEFDRGEYLVAIVYKIFGF